jgi:cystathionine gamma-lyase
MTPIYQTSTFVQEAPARHKGFEYSRTGNPTRAALEANLAALEGGRFGLAFASGLAATDALLHLLSVGGRVVAGNDIYGGTYRILTTVYRRAGLEAVFVDTTDLKALQKALSAKKTDLLWLESPTNPLLRVTDLAAACALARKRGALVAVDNTFATPYLQRPLECGADVVLHSTTKYLGGHSDVVGGALVTSDPGLRDRLAAVQNGCGGVPGPFDSWLVLRGTKTLAVRMERHCANALRVASFLEGRREVARVHYPGLPGHSQHDLARRQMPLGAGGMVSFEVKGGLEAARRVVTSTTLFALAESLGGVESLIEVPSLMTHASVPAEERRKSGLADGLVRLSVGIEEAEDLLEDLEQAFRRL